MAMIRIYGHKGMILAKPFQINSVDDEPEVITEEDEIINSFKIEEENKSDEQS